MLGGKYRILHPIVAQKKTFLAEKTLYDPETGHATVKLFTLKKVDRQSDVSVLRETEILKSLSGEALADMYIATYVESVQGPIQDYKPADGGSEVKWAGDRGSVDDMYIVSDYISGNSLQDLINKLIPTNQTIEFNELIKLFYQLAECVEFVHRHNYAHQNVKPSNFVLDNTIQRWKLIDFAVACSGDWQCGSNLGDPYYMSPELAAGTNVENNLQTKQKHDLFSLGVVFFQLSNPRTPFRNVGTDQTPAGIAQTTIAKSAYAAYIPINDLVTILTQTDPTKRPTAILLLPIIDKCRPACVVNGKERDKAYMEERLVAIGESVGSNDFETCKKFTDFFSNCHITGADYIKKDMQKIADYFGIGYNPAMNTNDLCALMRTRITTDQQDYMSRITTKLIMIIQYYAHLMVEMRAIRRGQRDDQLKGPERELIQSMDRIRNSLIYAFTDLWSISKEHNIININLFEQYREQAYSKYLVYSDLVPQGQQPSPDLKKIIDKFGIEQGLYVKWIAEYNPRFEVGGEKIQNFAQKTGESPLNVWPPI